MSPPGTIVSLCPQTFLLLLVLVLLPSRLDAQDLEEVADSNFALDLYQGPILGSSRVIGMGGANIGIAEGAAGMTGNVAAPAVRASTSLGKWDWDWNLDWQNPEIGRDLDNNGRATTTPGESLNATGGLLVQYTHWGMGVSVTSQQFDVVDSAGDPVLADFRIGRLILAGAFFDQQMFFGLGGRSATFTLLRVGTPNTRLVQITDSAPEVGVLFKPRHLNFRIGGNAARAIRSGQVVPGECLDTEDCDDFILPERIEAPWQVGGGIAWHWGKTNWNIDVPLRWRDERSFTLAMDLLFTGAVSEGNGVESYVNGQLQPSGEHVSFSWRMGFEYERIPGWFRFRAGTYWEPSRFEETSGRQHICAGAEVRFATLTVWKSPYRLRLSLTTDFARDYGNIGVSLGFWH